MDTRDDVFMGLALDQARLALERGLFPVGAVIAKGSCVLAVQGAERDVKGPLNHAELVAMSTAAAKGESLDGARLYSTLEPCVMCLGMALHCRIAAVVYAMEDPWGGSCSLVTSALPLRQRSIVTAIVPGVRRSEARAVLARWFATTTDAAWAGRFDHPLVRACVG